MEEPEEMKTQFLKKHDLSKICFKEWELTKVCDRLATSRAQQFENESFGLSSYSNYTPGNPTSFLGK